MDDLARELGALLNRYSAENASNTPEHILAEYLADCLAAWDKAIHLRALWYGRIDEPGRGSVPYPTPVEGRKRIEDGAS